MRIIATPLTSGPATPGFEEIATAYRYRGRAGWPYDPATHDDTRRDPPRTANAKRRSTAKEQKKRAFADALAKGMNVIQASRKVGIDPKTGYGYRKELDLEARQ